MQMDGGQPAEAWYQLPVIFRAEHIDFVKSAASNLLTRCDLPANTCVDEIAEGCQIRFQLRILITLVSIIVEACVF